MEYEFQLPDKQREGFTSSSLIIIQGYIHGICLVIQNANNLADGTIIDLFLPKSDRCLDGKLAFCKQASGNLTKAAATSISTTKLSFEMRD